ncbi:MAG: hypothetical protein GX470_07355 [Lentimicrobium sp.]|nr:hypothetical protein [Lentimicrobium sp.]
MIKKTLIIILLFAMTRFIISCCNEEGFNFEFSKVALTFENKIIQGSVNDLDSIKYDQLIGQIDLGYTRVACLNFNLSNNLYAFDCEPIYESIKKVSDVQIITINKFNDDKLEGSELVVSYKVFGYAMGFDGTKETLINILNQQYGRLPAEIVYLKFNETPNKNSYHRFAVNVIFDDETMISDTTNMIYLYD